LTAEQFTARQRYRVPGIVLPSHRTGATHKRYSPFGLILAARELGIRVPTELSVIGIDGHPYAEMFRLTTLAQHPRAQGELAVRTLLAELAARNGMKLRTHRESAGADPTDPSGTEDSIVLPTNLVIRSSTSAPRARLRSRS
ncbi:LacI family transcriptional regulator, partial [Cryobacterium sp. Hh7]|uniref:substrate-binding domain-containing protein n=1 Tax=Cryobacterium sp. Hh7 TaxID=1259159 RepID=UPI00106DA27C